jgi:hypothetical protein
VNDPNIILTIIKVPFFSKKAHSQNFYVNFEDFVVLEKIFKRYHHFFIIFLKIELLHPILRRPSPIHNVTSIPAPLPTQGEGQQIWLKLKFVLSLQMEGKK